MASDGARFGGALARWRRWGGLLSGRRFAVWDAKRAEVYPGTRRVVPRPKD